MAKPRFLVVFTWISAGVFLVSGIRDESFDDEGLSDLDGFQLFTEEDVLVLTEEEADGIEGMPDSIEDNSLSVVKWWRRASESELEASFVDTTFFGRRRRRSRRRSEPRRRNWFKNAVNTVNHHANTVGSHVSNGVKNAVKTVGNAVSNVSKVVKTSWGEVSKTVLCKIPYCDTMCYLQDQITALRQQLEFLTKKRLPAMRDMIKDEQERIESAKRNSIPPWNCNGNCTQKQKNAQEWDRRNATSAEEFAQAAEAKVAEYRERISRLSSMLKSNLCQILKDQVQKIKNFIAKHLCTIISIGLSVAAGLADKALAAAAIVGTAGAAGGLAPLQLQSWCVAAAMGGTGMVSKVVGSGANIAMKGVSIIAGASDALCAIGKASGKVAGEHIKEGSRGIMNWDKCEIFKFTTNVILFALNVACGQLFSGVTYVIMPLIMCKLPLGENGAMCQMDGCYE